MEKFLVFSVLCVGITCYLPRGFHLVPKDAQWMLKGCSMVASTTLSTLSLVPLYIVTLYITLFLFLLLEPNSLHAVHSRTNVRKPACPISAHGIMSRYTLPAIWLFVPDHARWLYSLRYNCQNSCRSDERLSFSLFSCSIPALGTQPLPLHFRVYAAHNVCYQHVRTHHPPMLSTLLS